MVFVFKTDISIGLETKVKTILSSLKTIDKVGFDFEDCDNILRIEAQKDIVSDIESLLISKGFLCKEL
ncbi:hypothetical protein [Pontimicrobium sp. IMCC45349]|uniref:hypothetical protein n=1 Tax=Pontimicrobium sp. IMCC45349 TaxID=3391574 RepID=UPI00399F39F8